MSSNPEVHDGNLSDVVWNFKFQWLGAWLLSWKLTYPPDKAYLKTIFLFPRWAMYFLGGISYNHASSNGMRTKTEADRKRVLTDQGIWICSKMGLLMVSWLSWGIQSLHEPTYPSHASLEKLPSWTCWLNARILGTNQSEVKKWNQFEHKTPSVWRSETWNLNQFAVVRSEEDCLHSALIPPCIMIDGVVYYTAAIEDVHQDAKLLFRKPEWSQVCHGFFTVVQVANADYRYCGNHVAKSSRGLEARKAVGRGETGQRGPGQDFASPKWFLSFQQGIASMSRIW